MDEHVPTCLIGSYAYGFPLFGTALLSEGRQEAGDRAHLQRSEIHSAGEVVDPVKLPRWLPPLRAVVPPFETCFHLADTFQCQKLQIKRIEATHRCRKSFRPTLKRCKRSMEAPRSKKASKERRSRSGRWVGKTKVRMISSLDIGGELKASGLA